MKCRHRHQAHWWHPYCLSQDPFPEYNVNNWLKVVRLCVALDKNIEIQISYITLALALLEIDSSDRLVISSTSSC